MGHQKLKKSVPMKSTFLAAATNKGERKKPPPCCSNNDTSSFDNCVILPQGWIIKMKLKSPEELNELMTEEDYDKFVREMETD